MKVKELAILATEELRKTLECVDEFQIQELMNAICAAKKVYVAGAGRSLLMLRCLAMRLMHLGFESYVVGDTTTPAFEADDLLIVGSGSGETGGLVNVVTKAKKLKGKIVVITIRKESTLGQMADLLVEISAYTDKVKMEDKKLPVLAGGSLFEQSMLFLMDAMIIPLGEKANIATDQAFVRHANLE